MVCTAFMMTSSYCSAFPSTTCSACFLKNQKATAASTTPPVVPMAPGRKRCRRLGLSDAGFFTGAIVFAYTLRMLAELLLKWPLIRQLRGDEDAAMSERTRALRPKNEPAQVARSICPYCGVGCGQLVYHREGKLLSIEGDPQSPISRGHLCPKGAASYELVTHPARATT